MFSAGRPVQVPLRHIVHQKQRHPSLARRKGRTKWKQLLLHRRASLLEASSPHFLTFLQGNSSSLMPQVVIMLAWNEMNDMRSDITINDPQVSVLLACCSVTRVAVAVRNLPKSSLRPEDQGLRVCLCPYIINNICAQVSE